MGDMADAYDSPEDESIMDENLSKEEEEMTPTPHDAAMDAAWTSYNGNDVLADAIQAYLSALCADARVVEAVLRVFDMEVMSCGINMSREEKGERGMKAALSALCEMGGVR